MGAALPPLKIYMAGALFTLGEHLWNRLLAIGLRAAGHEVWLPQEHQPPSTVPHDLFRKCIEGIVWCDVVLASMDGPDPDSGTCGECGFAYQKRPIIVYRTDFRAGGEPESGFGYNLVLGCFATIRLNLSHLHWRCYPAADAITAILLALDSPEIREHFQGRMP